MLKFEVEFYEEKGKNLIEEFLNNLTKKEKAKIYKFIHLLDEKGLKMPYEYCKKFPDPKLWELIIDYGTNTFRVFYIYDNSKIILLHAIRKKTKKTPVSDKELAKKE
ncbi:MAG: type II toxin-antitoxin system RelE/ParE family toxin [Deltaproteobacteria bacterium]|jgi:phage-related protein|nr:type II toxin-antitoxin system RelE/ParE family toxin [Deltaproteobacteria bacterium]